MAILFNDATVDILLAANPPQQLKLGKRRKRKFDPKTRPSILPEYCSFAAAVYLRTWVFVDRRFLPFCRATSDADIVSDLMSLRLYLSTYGINRTLSLGTDDDESQSAHLDPEEKLAERLRPLQTTLRDVVANRTIVALLKGLQGRYRVAPLSAASKCLWMIGQDREGTCADNDALLYDKWAVKGLERLVGREALKVAWPKNSKREATEPADTASDVHSKSAGRPKKKTPVPYDHRAAEYEKFSTAWREQYGPRLMLLSQVSPFARRSRTGLLERVGRSYCRRVAAQAVGRCLAEPVVPSPRAGRPPTACSRAP